MESKHKIWTALALGTALSLYFIYWRKSKLQARDLSLVYKSDCSAAQEEEVKIRNLYLYPIRGIRSPNPVDEIYVGPHGCKYDRELILICPQSKKRVTSGDEKNMRYLEQQLIGAKVHVTTKRPELLRAKGLPETIVLDLDVDPTKIGELYKGKSHEGHRYPHRVCDWFSTAVERPLILCHSPMERQMPLNPNRHIEMRQGDTRKTYTSDAALHIVNHDSVADLRRRVEERYPNGLDDLWVDAEQFRSNIIIETGQAYSEDLFSELRIGSCLFRSAGPCIRCNDIRTNYETKNRLGENEPNATLAKYRNLHEKGVIFGMYFQMEIMTKSEYNQICTKQKGFQTYEESL